MRRVLMAAFLGAIFALMSIGGVAAADGDPVGGNAVIDRSHLDGWEDIYLVDRNNPFDTDGSITQWEIYAENTHQVQLVIYRNSGGWSVVGKSEVVTPEEGYNRFTLGNSISVRDGDYVGLHFPDEASVPYSLYSAYDFGEGNLTGTVLQTHEDGGETAFAVSSNRRYSVRAYGNTDAQGDDDEDDNGWEHKEYNGRGLGHESHGNGLGIGHERHGNGVGMGHERHGDG